MSTWAIVYLVVILKIPLAFALYVVWYAIKAEPIPEEGVSGEERGPKRKPPLNPRSPRRGPVGGAGCRPIPCPQTDSGFSLAGKTGSSEGSAACRRRRVHLHP
jgi:hypothetical protein